MEQRSVLVGTDVLMRRTGRFTRARTLAVVAVASVCVALAGCASGSEAASQEAIAEAASASGIAPELVYTTEVDGYDLAPQSVGPGAADGMTATWFNSSTGATLTIRSDFGELTEASCAATPLWVGPSGSVTCAREDGVWHRSAEGSHEYVAVREGALIWVTGMDDASQSDLLTAAKNVHVPSAAELELLFSEVPKTAGEPEERGNLPANGDGAPIDPSGSGG